jgi:hypothetical protein
MSAPPCSGFSEIFDLDYFRYRLRKEINIVRVDEMPIELQSEDKWHMGNRQYLGQPEVRFRSLLHSEQADSQRPSN